MNINTQWLVSIAALLLLAGMALLFYVYQRKNMPRKHIDELLANQKEDVGFPSEGLKSKMWQERLAAESSAWVNTKWGKKIVAAEDRALLIQCGFQTSQSPTYFLLVRLACSLFFPIIALIILNFWISSNQKFLVFFASAVIGFLAPKWFLRRKASKRANQANKELPILVDLLGLLQGAGLSIDQSLHLIVKDFRSVMPVLSGELDVANRLHASGRPREQAFHRMSEMFQSDALADLTALIVQIDKYGGAVQEPLRQFGERLREQRRMRMKEEIGKITVKMTGVMVLTLLPSLLIITAGPGFLSVIRALGGMK